MQNLQTLITLGFQQNTLGEWFYRGTHQKFVAKVVENNGPVYVTLFKVCKEIDTRPLSDTKGRHLKTFIKDCISSQSVEKALVKYDLPDNQLVSHCGILQIFP